MAQTASSVATQVHIQGRGLAHSHIYPISDLLEPVKGPDLWNDSARSPGLRLTTGYLRGVLVRAR